MQGRATNLDQLCLNGQSATPARSPGKTLESAAKLQAAPVHRGQAQIASCQDFDHPGTPVSVAAAHTGDHAARHVNDTSSRQVCRVASNADVSSIIDHRDIESCAAAGTIIDNLSGRTEVCPGTKDEITPIRIRRRQYGSGGPE